MSKTNDKTSAVSRSLDGLVEQLRQKDAEIKNLEEMVDRAHEALNLLLTDHLNIASDGAKIARRGIWGD
jgi:hypothetical protein